MTKADIVAGIAQSTGIEKKAVTVVVESFMEAVSRSLIEKEPIYLRGFGSFIVKRRAEKVARDISKNTTIVVPAHDIPAFKPSKELLKAVSDKSR